MSSFAFLGGDGELRRDRRRPLSVSVAKGAPNKAPVSGPPPASAGADPATGDAGGGAFGCLSAAAASEAPDALLGWPASRRPVAGAALQSTFTASAFAFLVGARAWPDAPAGPLPSSPHFAFGTSKMLGAAAAAAAAAAAPSSVAAGAAELLLAACFCSCWCCISRAAETHPQSGPGFLRYLPEALPAPSFLGPDRAPVLWRGLRGRLRPWRRPSGGALRLLPRLPLRPNARLGAWWAPPWRRRRRGLRLGRAVHGDARVRHPHEGAHLYPRHLVAENATDVHRLVGHIPLPRNRHPEEVAKVLVIAKGRHRVESRASRRNGLKQENHEK